MAEARRGEVALVTGGARRIGAAIVEALAGAGYAVAIHCHDSRAEAEQLAARIAKRSGRATVVVGDLADAAETEALIPSAAAALGPLTLLVNNASLFERDEAATVTPASFDRHMAINLRAPLLLARVFAAALPADRGGAIVNLTDQRVGKLAPHFLSYTLTKVGLDAATVTLAQALAPRIRVNAVAPGPTLANARQRPQDFAKQSAAVPLGRGGTPQEVADAVLWLARAGAVTGTTIFVDGGQHIEWRTRDVTGARE